MRGPNTCFPIAGGSKRMACVVLSTPEAELYAAFYALRIFGIPAISFWSTILGREDLRLQFHEDNQTMIRIMTTGRNFQMRYATRTSRLPIAWMHERFKAGDLDLRYEVSSRMAADIYTKAFSDSDKWQAACWLINIVDPKIIQSAVKYVTYDEPDLGKVAPEDYQDEDLALVAVGEEGELPQGGNTGEDCALPQGGSTVISRKELDTIRMNLLKECNEYMKHNTIKTSPSPQGDKTDPTPIVAFPQGDSDEADEDEDPAMWQGLDWEPISVPNVSAASPAQIPIWTNSVGNSENEAKNNTVTPMEFPQGDTHTLSKPLAFASDIVEDKYGYRVHSRLKFAL